jgi:DNA helicase-2/ATP-dependent DNA helicase PcrA
LHIFDKPAFRVSQTRFPFSYLSMRRYTLHAAAPAAGGIDFSKELNAQQLAAVTAAPGPALVIAGAGSGKTRTLTYRVAWLLEQGVPPERILLLTFTNKAAREMMQRVGDLVANDLGSMWGGTFHSIGNRILRRHPESVGFAKGFNIMDRDDQEELIAAATVQVLETQRIEKRFPKADVLGELYSFALNTGADLAAVVRRREPLFIDFIPVIAAVRDAYEARKRAANTVDFDDLIEKPLRILREKPEIAAIYQNRFQVILVDEYQDTNHLQSEFIDILAAGHRNVMVVGDDAQCIYTWRGADFRNILEFPKRYAGATVYKIETNYRSFPQILDVANHVISHNVQQFEKSLAAARPAGPEKPALVPLPDSGTQARFVAQRILEAYEEGVSLREMAVLYRAHYQSMEIQLELTRRGIPFQITSGMRFFEQAHVKDVAAYIKFVVNPRDEIAFKRLVRMLPGVGPASAERIWASVAAIPQEELAADFAAGLVRLKVPAKALNAWGQLAATLGELAPGGELASPAQMVQTILEAGYREYLATEYENAAQRREDLEVLQSFARQFESAAEFLDQLALLTNMETESVSASRESTDLVTLSSVHQAKGLEWVIVFVVWMTEGMFPSARSLDSEEGVEEERRLFYVAVTRARDALFLTYPQLRLGGGSYGGDPFQRPSRFLGEIPAKALETYEVEYGAVGYDRFESSGCAADDHDDMDHSNPSADDDHPF